MPQPPLHVGVLAYDGCLGSEIFGIADVLLMANRIALAQRSCDRDLFRVTVMASPQQGGSVTAAGGVSVAAQPWHTRIDTLVVPGFDVASPRAVGDRLTRWDAETAFIAGAASNGVPIASVCVGPSCSAAPASSTIVGRPPPGSSPTRSRSATRGRSSTQTR